MGAMAPQITCLTIIYSTVDSGADQRKHQCSTSPAFLREYHRWPVNSPHKRPVTRKMFPFDDVFMTRSLISTSWDPSSELYTCWPCPRQFTSELTLVSLWEFHNIHKVCLSLLALSRDRHHRTYTESVNLYRNFCLSLYPFHDLGHIAEFEDWTIMAGWYFCRMLLLLELVAHMLAYNDTDQCPVCHWYKIAEFRGISCWKTRRTILVLQTTDTFSESCPTIPSPLLLISRCVLVIHILCLHPTTERRRYFVTTSLIGWM